MTTPDASGNSAEFLEAARIRLVLLQKYSQSFKRVRADYGNIVESLEWCHAAKEWQLALDLAEQLQSFLHLDGHWQDASTYADYAIKAAQELRLAPALTRWTYYAGLIQDEMGEYDKAERYYHESLRLAEAQGDWSTQAEACRRLGWLAHAQGKRSDARAHYLKALQLHRHAADALGRARDWRHLGLLAIDQDQYARAGRCLKFSYELIGGETTQEVQQLKGDIELDRGRLALRQGRLELARENLEQARQYAQQTQDRLLQRDADLFLGHIYEQQKDPARAEKKYRDCFDTAAQAGDSAGQASALLSLGTLALRQSHYADAQAYYQNALLHLDRASQAATKAQLGTLAYRQGRYPEACRYLNEALEVFCADERWHDQAVCYHQLGLVAQAMREWEQADQYHSASLDIRHRLGLFCDEVWSWYQRGVTARQSGKLDQAHEYFQKAFDLGTQHKCPDLDRIQRALEQSA